MWKTLANFVQEQRQQPHGNDSSPTAIQFQISKAVFTNSQPGVTMCEPIASARRAMTDPADSSAIPADSWSRYSRRGYFQCCPHIKEGYTDSESCSDSVSDSEPTTGQAATARLQQPGEPTTGQAESNSQAKAPPPAPPPASPLVEVPDWVQAVTPGGWVAIPLVGVNDTKIWHLWSAVGAEWGAVAQCQHCGGVVQTPSGRGGAPSEHMHEHWHKKRKTPSFEASGGIYCSADCQRAAQT